MCIWKLNLCIRTVSQLLTLRICYNLLNLAAFLPFVTGEVQPELQVQGAHWGKRLQHLRLSPLEAWGKADVRFTERAREAAARPQGSTKAPVHSLPAHAPILAVQAWTLTSN